MRYYPNQRIIILNTFEKALIFYLIGMGLASIVNFIFDLKTKNSTSTPDSSISINKYFSDKEKVKLISILTLSTLISVSLVLQKKSKEKNQRKIDSSNLNHLRGGSTDKNMTLYQHDDEYPPIYNSTIDPEDYFYERMRYSILRHIIRTEFVQRLGKYLGFIKVTHREKILAQAMTKFFLERTTLNKILQSKAIACLPHNKQVFLLNSPYLIETIRNILAIPRKDPIGITPAFFTLFVRQHSLFIAIMAKSFLDHIIQVGRTNAIININLIHVVTAVGFFTPVTTLAFFLHVKPFAHLGLVKKIKKIALIRNMLVGTKILSLITLVLASSFAIADRVYPCYDYFMPLHQHPIEIIVDNYQRIASVGYQIPNSFIYRDEGAVFVTPASEISLDNKASYTDEEISERWIFRNEKTAFTNMANEDQASYHLKTLELPDVPILTEQSLVDLIKDNLQDFETVTLTPSEKEFLNNIKDEIIDVKAEEIKSKGN